LTREKTKPNLKKITRWKLWTTWRYDKKYTHTHTNNNNKKHISGSTQTPYWADLEGGKSKTKPYYKETGTWSRVENTQPTHCNNNPPPCSLLLTDGLLGRVHAQRLQQSADGFMNKPQISSCRNTHELKKKEWGVAAMYTTNLWGRGKLQKKQPDNTNNELQCFRSFGLLLLLFSVPVWLGVGYYYQWAINRISHNNTKLLTNKKLITGRLTNNWVEIRISAQKVLVAGECWFFNARNKQTNKQKNN